MKRSPWFNARAEPPVNGDNMALYEHRCPRGMGTHLLAKHFLLLTFCPHCEWRGLLRKEATK